MYFLHSGKQSGNAPFYILLIPLYVLLGHVCLLLLFCKFQIDFVSLERNLQAPPGKPRDVRKERDTKESDRGDICSEGWAHLSKSPDGDGMMMVQSEGQDGVYLLPSATGTDPEAILQ